jgi:hypothetical protein
LIFILSFFSSEGGNLDDVAVVGPAVNPDMSSSAFLFPLEVIGVLGGSSVRSAGKSTAGSVIGFGRIGFGSRDKAAIAFADFSSSRSCSSVDIATSSSCSSFSSSEKGSTPPESDSPDAAALSL